MAVFTAPCTRITCQQLITYVLCRQLLKQTGCRPQLAGTAGRGPVRGNCHRAAGLAGMLSTTQSSRLQPSSAGSPARRATSWTDPCMQHAASTSKLPVRHQGPWYLLINICVML